MLYEDAPSHVANFAGTDQIRFYNGRTCPPHCPGYMIQGGCPKGDGPGIRLDGKRVPAELTAAGIRGHRILGSVGR